MRAATDLVPLLQAAGTGILPHLWRGDQWSPADTRLECTPTGHPELDRELPGRGWTHGQLVELLLDHPGIGELTLLMPALVAASRAARTCVWVLPCASAPSAPEASDAASPGSQALPYAPALSESGVDLTHNIFVKPMTVRECGWALEQSLRAAHLGVLIGWMPHGSSSDADFRSLRRLHLLAQRNHALVFILRAACHAASPSPAALRLHLQHDGAQLQVKVLKRRGRPLIEPVALQIHPAHWNRPAVPVPAAAAPVPSTSVPKAVTPAPALAPSLPKIVRALSPAAGWFAQPSMEFR